MVSKLKDKIEDLVRNKKTQLPTLPMVVDKVLNAAIDEKTSSKDLSGFINNDQALANKILRLSNSAYYGQMKQVDTIQRAITVVGFNEIIGLTIGMSVFSAFKQNPVHEVFDIRDLWLHSVGCATAAKEIGMKTGMKADEKLFLNGLLHDMGKVIFVVYFPKEYKAVLEDAGKNETVLFLKEKEILGIDHAVLSGLLMERWNFPESLVYPCRFHHDPTDCPQPYRYQATIVGLADFLCHQAGIGSSGNSVPDIPKTTARELRLSEKDLKELLQVLKKKRSSIQEFFELIK
ncbi:MAG: HDOD domain-containing protein [Desulfobacterales bacterium]|uniref:HDOD domain-containing protein n=1 Tax=Candidatus Desulfatibia profunda TaxID=2841695 RepID=A0A8J6TH59_9BACT|nr:HDOD domain-containing protein [Candidatus Desulfatibia profunda]MBL7178597.1 HDOD domain-containing protein [Desulfobacterales bacterium]